MDEYLWGFTDSVDDVRHSILWSYLVGLAFLFLGSDDVVTRIPTETPSYPTLGKIMNFVAGRLRTLVLAVGAVNFWRAVWLLWDEYLGQTSVWSAAVNFCVRLSALIERDLVELTLFPSHYSYHTQSASYVYSS